MSSSSSDLISDQFNQQLSLDPELNQHDENDNDDDFTFMLIGEDDLPIYSDNVTEDGQIRQVFPLFDQKLLLNDNGEYDVEEIHQLPIHPPVDKIFIESPRGFPVQENKQNDDSDSATGPYCEWSKESVTIISELSKKSNSTGFSKLWRLREKVNRSNSDGRDAFVFLKNTDRTTVTASVTPSSSSSSSSSSVKSVNGDGKVKVVKAKKATVSAHEVYLRSKNGGHTEEERRKTYLPYRPELMGLFTNVHSGLSKNVHPY